MIVPTYSERESNARRLASLGVAELQIPVVDETGEKKVSGAAFAETVQAMLAGSSYRTKAEALSIARRSMSFAAIAGPSENVADKRRKACIGICQVRTNDVPRHFLHPRHRLEPSGLPRPRGLAEHGATLV